MIERGHDRDAMQCRIKVKELRSAYRKAREANSRSGAPPKTCRFYKELDAILGGDPTTVPSTTMDTGKRDEEEGVEENRSEGAVAGGDTPDSLGACSQELFSSQEEGSQSQRPVRAGREREEQVHGKQLLFSGRSFFRCGVLGRGGFGLHACLDAEERIDVVYHIGEIGHCNLFKSLSQKVGNALAQVYWESRRGPCPIQGNVSAPLCREGRGGTIAAHRQAAYGPGQKPHCSRRPSLASPDTLSSKISSRTNSCGKCGDSVQCRFPLQLLALPKAQKPVGQYIRETISPPLLCAYSPFWGSRGFCALCLGQENCAVLETVRALLKCGGTIALSGIKQ
ncbi:uncharacterized protein RBU57_003621 [Macrochelys suwanniensis]